MFKSQGGQLSLEFCDVTSSTGTGVSSEGGNLSVTDTSIHDCAANGMALYADIEGIGSNARVEKCQISSSKLNGILIREGSHLSLQNCKIDGNSGFGLAIKVLSKMQPRPTFTDTSCTRLSSINSILRML